MKRRGFFKIVLCVLLAPFALIKKPSTVTYYYHPSQARITINGYPVTSYSSGGMVEYLTDVPDPEPAEVV